MGEFAVRSASRPRVPRSIRALSLAALAVMSLSALRSPSPAWGQEGATTPHWIWHPTPKPSTIPAETRYFRKLFSVKEPSRLVLDVTADDTFRFYLDGKE